MAPAPPPGPSLIPLTGILAVAYNDIDGLPGYSTGDVLIARLVDTDGNGPDAGDRIEMGRYPTNLDATGFGEWGDKTHTVGSLTYAEPSRIRVVFTSGGTHTWWREDDYHEYAGHRHRNGRQLRAARATASALASTPA